MSHGRHIGAAERLELRGWPGHLVGADRSLTVPEIEPSRSPGLASAEPFRRALMIGRRWDAVGFGG